MIVRSPLLPASLHVLRLMLTAPIEMATPYEVAPLGEDDSAIVHRESPLVTVTVTVQPASAFAVQVLKSIVEPVVVMLLAPVLTTSLPPAGSDEIVETLQVMVTRPPATVNLLAVDPDLEVSAAVAVSVTTQVALPPVHVKLAEAVGANAQAAITTTRARSPSLGMSLMMLITFLV